MLANSGTYFILEYTDGLQIFAQILQIIQNATY